MPGILITAGSALTMESGAAHVSPGWVLIEGRRIAAVGQGRPDAETAARAGERFDVPHGVILPGMVNAHTHLSQTFMRGLADGRSLLSWLREIIWPLQDAMTPQEVGLASLLGLVENVRAGATAVVQHHKLTRSPAHVDAALEAAERIGVRMLLARGWVDLGGSAEDPGAVRSEMSRLHRDWHGAAAGRLKIGFGPMAVWRCSEELLVETAGMARSWGLANHIHAAESADEIDMLQARTGMRHIEWLDHIGVLGPEMQLVHAVHVTEAEIETIAQRGATVIHCPTSNLYLASGAAPVAAMARAGIPIALGTDGPASNNAQDLLETCKTAALLAKLQSGDPNALLPHEILQMASARVQTLFGDPDLGRLAPGARADLTVVDLSGAHAQPVHSPESALVYNAVGSDVAVVIVDGEVLLAGGRLRTIDEEELLDTCRRAAAALLERAGIHLYGH